MAFIYLLPYRQEFLQAFQVQAEEVKVLAALDFFPGAAQELVASVLDDWEHTISERLSQDEPHAVQRRIKLLQRPDYQGGGVGGRGSVPGSTDLPAPG